jgi:hypothetical protein
MHLLVSALELHMPEFVKKRALTELFNASAEAFGLEVPPLTDLNSEVCLAEYACFVQAHAKQRLHDKHGIDELSQCLYRNAMEMVRLLNKWLRLRTIQDVMVIGRVLYRILGIDLRGNARGEIVINRCYFSDFYTADVCRLMSAMDRGLFAGLSNGGELRFTSRITEGQPCCRAHFYLPEMSASETKED